MMKIAYIITRSDIVGGAHIHVRDMALSMLERGHEVLVIMGRSGPYTCNLQDNLIPFVSLDYLVREIMPYFDWRAFWEIRGILSRFKPDLVSTHSSKAGWLGRIVCKSLGIPVLFTAHGWAFTEGISPKRRSFYRLAESLVAPIADRIITVSDYDRKLALNLRVAPSNKLVTIHNGVADISGNRRLNVEGDVPIIIMVARFEEQKDHESLFRALDKIRDKKWALQLIGDGPLRTRYENLVNNFWFRERVDFLGSRNDVAVCLSKAHIFVLSSNWEGFPRSILEAMRAGLPIVASDVGGVSEAVINGKTGFLVPKQDIQSFKDRLEKLISEPTLRISMGESGRKRYENNFTLDIMVQTTANIYEEVLRVHSKS